jgi:hypothetical protein
MRNDIVAVDQASGMPFPGLSVTWRKSSWSTYNGNCVEIARLHADGIGVRDTKDRGAGPVLSFSLAEWGSFLVAVKQGTFDRI